MRRRPSLTAMPRLRWAALLGLILGMVMAVVLQAPAAWLGHGIGLATQQRILLLNPRGTLWQGESTLALGAGPGGTGSTALPGRLAWQLGPAWVSGAGLAWRLHLEHPGVLSPGWRVLVIPGWRRLSVTLESPAAPAAAKAQVPAAWLSGLGAPWNTLQLSGQLILQVQSFQWEAAGGTSPPSLSTALTVQLLNMASRVATLPVLGHYELDLRGGPELSIRLSSRPGSALVLEGQGRWAPGSRVEFRGQATAATGREEALSNLLNIIGRRDGARSVIALGT